MKPAGGFRSRYGTGRTKHEATLLPAAGRTARIDRGYEFPKFLLEPVAGPVLHSSH
jgi:hypothetical protein